MASPPAASIFNTVSNSLYIQCAFLLEWGESTTPRENGQAGLAKITSPGNYPSLKSDASWNHLGCRIRFLR